MLWAHGGEITADEMGELALLSLPVVLLLVVFVVAAQRARNASRGERKPARVSPEGTESATVAGLGPREGR
jgi:hypothetical protein